ncbi:hypothetical protein NC651_034483 [Populus alba x Populus x berolinensis]|nr:hypothetical protein NC651_034483 [Populus alba x Populus x berolinensis]
MDKEKNVLMVHGSAAWTHSGLPVDRFPTINAWTTEERNRCSCFGQFVDDLLDLGEAIQNSLYPY